MRLSSCLPSLYLCLFNFNLMPGSPDLNFEGKAEVPQDVNIKKTIALEREII